MRERVAALLAHASVHQALEEPDLVEVLSDVVPMSEDYIPVLQFLMRPDNLVALISCLLQEPATGNCAAERRPPVKAGEMPTYDAYATVYRAHWIFCSSSFSMQLIASMIALKDVPRRDICALLLEFNSRDNMNLEAYTRFLNTFMDQYSPEFLLAYFETSDQTNFIETLLVLVVYEPIRDVVLRICNEIPDGKVNMSPLLGVLLYQLSPFGLLESECYDSQAPSAMASCCARDRMVKDMPHERFSRMVFTCDLLTDLIHEGRTGSLGFAFVQTLVTDEYFCKTLLDAVLLDLRVLPTDFANESYTIKVLNSLLQQTQCGCVTKALNDAASSSTPRPTSTSSTDSENVVHDSPHNDLPLLWKVFLTRLPEVLAFISIPPHTHFKTTHMQLVYLTLPVLNVACMVADRCVIEAKTMETLLELMVRFPESNILHCAISRLFIVALEDSPFMFGKELPAFRAAHDPLRMHLLLNGAFQLVLDVFDKSKANPQSQSVRHRPPPAFLDVAISFDQAVTTAHAYSAHVFESSGVLLQRWQDFRNNVLLPTQTIWEEQYQVANSSASTGDGSPRGPDVMEEAIQVNGSDNSVQITPSIQPSNPEGPLVDSPRMSGPESPTKLFPALATPTATTGPSVATVISAVEDVPTPLSALYNDEEKNMMLKVARHAQPAPEN